MLKHTFIKKLLSIFIITVMCAMTLTSCSQETPDQYNTENYKIEDTEEEEETLTEDAEDNYEEEPTQEYIVYITKTGDCYHRSNCSCLNSSCMHASLDWAIANGYRPCLRCKP